MRPFFAVQHAVIASATLAGAAHSDASVEEASTRRSLNGDPQ